MEKSDSVIVSALPFGNIYYWSVICRSAEVGIDVSEHFEKMSFRNRYYIAQAHGKHCLSIPLISGRNQHTPIKDVKISYAENWSRQHWRSLYSSYNRSPYFEYYKDELEHFFQQQHVYLLDFNLASFEWIKKQLNLSFETTFQKEYRQEHPGKTDLRKISPHEKTVLDLPFYHQVFEDRNGFLPNLSVLDLLFNEGRYAAEYLRSAS